MSSRFPWIACGRSPRTRILGSRCWRNSSGARSRRLRKNTRSPPGRSATTWRWSFLNNEVVVNYALRIKRDFDGGRLWVNAYTNDVSFYIPSSRLVKEGGYEVNNSLAAAVTYGQPEHVQPPLEERIIDGVRQVLPESYRSPQKTPAAQPSSQGRLAPIGVAKVDITPDYPVRMYGYAIRTTESEGVAGRLKAAALAIGGDEGDGPAVLLTVDCGSVPARNPRGSAPPRPGQGDLEARAIHALQCPHPFGTEPGRNGHVSPMNRREHIVRYEKNLTDRLEEVVLKAMASRKPGRLDWTQGTVDFAMNRRLLKNGKWVNFGAVADAPVDRSLPLLRVTDESGKLLAVLVNYACHNTTLGQKITQLHGDWAGCAQEFIEADQSRRRGHDRHRMCGRCQSVSAGQGRVELCQRHGRAMADEVKRLLAGR